MNGLRFSRRSKPSPPAAIGTGHRVGRPAATRQGSNNLFSGGSIALAAALVYYSVNAKVEDSLQPLPRVAYHCWRRAAGIVVAKSEDRKFPVFEVLLLTCINTYAIPLLGRP